jgi:hypothetical protein
MVFAGSGRILPSCLGRAQLSGCRRRLWATSNGRVISGESTKIKIFLSLSASSVGIVATHSKIFWPFTFKAVLSFLLLIGKRNFHDICVPSWTLLKAYPNDQQIKPTAFSHGQTNANIFGVGHKSHSSLICISDRLSIDPLL